MFGIFGKKGTGKIHLGTRVVRGPNWNHKSEDNGEGFLGTIVALCHSDRTIQVIWDTGRSGKYRADPNQYDLRLFDNAPTDQLHKKTFCFSCKETPIYGMKWTCTKCNINLCTQCYMGDYHDVEHIFERTVTSESRRFKVRSRQNSTEKIAAKGIFEGAEVVDGPHNRNDDHNNDVGYVEQITNWKNKYQRGIVKVFWKNTEIENIHRLGAEGYVDVVCSRLTENATWGKYYPDHLPVIDFDYVCSNIPGSVFSDVNFYMQMKYDNLEKISITELKQDTASDKFQIWKAELKQDTASDKFQIWKGTWLTQQSKPVRVLGSYNTLDILHPAGVLQLCDHNNIIQLYGITPTLDLMVTEFFSEIDLLTFLRQSENRNKEDKVDLAKLVHIASQVACGMDYLGTKRILHRDLRAGHVLINDKLETKIFGFHYSVVLREDEDQYNQPDDYYSDGHQFSVKWAAIEVALYEKYTIKSDIWSFGIFLVELTTLGQIPYPGITIMELLGRLHRGYRHEKPYNCPENIYKIMLSCWNKEPTKRPTFEYLFNYFDDYVVSAELEKEEIDKYLRSGKNNGDQIQIQYGKEEVQESCEEDECYTEASELDVHNVDNTLQFTLPPRNPTLGINTKRSSTNKQHVYENVDVRSNNVEDTKLKLHQVVTADIINTAGDLAVCKSEQEYSEVKGDHKEASGVDVHSDASDVDKNSQFALPPRNPTLGINTKRSSTNKPHVYENVDVCSNNLEDTKLRLQQVVIADTITKCDDIPVYLSEEEEDDNKEPCGIEVHSDASADNKILKSGLPSRSLDL